MSLQSRVYGFIPTSITGCTLWLDGADPAGNGVVPANNATVSTWADKSGNGLTVSAASSQPTYSTNVVNNLGTVAFNGSQGLSAGSVTAGKLLGTTGASAIFCVFSVSNNTQSSCPFSWDDSSYTYRFMITWESGVIFDLGDSSAGIANRRITIPSSSITFANNTYYLVSFWQSGGVAILNVNGGLYTVTTSSGFTGNIPTSTSRTFNVGPYINSSGYNMKGNTAEIIIYNTNIPSNFQQVEGYLAQKWGLRSSLPVGHPGLGTTLFRADFTKQNAMTARPFYTAFSPTQISGCSLWLDGADPAGNGVIPAIGTSIATWVDKSGLSQTITQANSANQAVYSSGGGLTFTSGKQYPLNTSVFMTMFSVAYTIFIIEKRALSGTFFIIGNTAGGGGPLYIGYQSTTAMRFSTASVIDMDYSIPAYSGSDATEPIRIWAFRWFGSAANLRDIGLNGQLSPQTQAFNQAPSFSGNQTIGASAYGNYVGRLYEIIIFNKAISDSEKQKVESYLAQKWGLVSSLPGGHLNATQPAGAITLTALTNFRILSRSRGSPITSTTLNTIATYLRNYMSEFRNPSFYGYNLDGNSYHINDGGGDMYDAGNWTNPWLIAGTQITGASSSQQAFTINYSSTTATTVDTDFVYASLGYATSSGTTITSNHPLTVLGFRTTTGRPVGFQLAGNSGADGGGTLASGILYAGDIIQGFTVHAFYRETYNAGDPSHCNLFILLGHPSWISVFGTISSFADPVANGGNGCFFYTSGAGVSNILAIQTLLSKSGGVLVTAAECQTVVQAFVNRVKLAVGF